MRLRDGELRGSTVALSIGAFDWGHHENQIQARRCRIDLTVCVGFVCIYAPQRGAESDDGAKVSATSLPTIVESRLREGLIAKGYELVDSEDTADAKVTFRLRAFQFYIEQGFWSGGQNANAVLAADARRGEKDFTNVYRYSNEKRIQVIPDGGGIDTQMNSVLSEVLNKALADTSLDAFLTGKPAP